MFPALVQADETLVPPGLVIDSLWLSRDKRVLKFVTSAGEFALEAVGDCCSYSWFEHISSVQSLLGQPLLAVEERELYGPGWLDDNEYVRSYGYDLVTPRGKCLIEFRNSSNGYYGGNLEPCTCFEGIVFDQITADF